ncbi:10505_t:CDS:2 [Cetraspora pellucida]|uniref:10505_t:CDS:1 n=1 Tax=Cetraspora pellucida TaxID=1433469 RepID=A0A9N9HY11_9GLOM|nr:10505_t:CDS:2 [Cetraspora pellucida]
MTGRGIKRVLAQTSDSEDENNLITESSGAQQSRQHSDNNDKRSICWRYFNPFKVPKRGDITKCTIDGCNKKYTWSGSTSNLVKHLKTKHSIPSTTAIQSSLINNSFRNFEIYLPVIKFIASSILPFDIVDNLKSSGLVHSQITPSIIANQISQVYNYLFSQLKSKVQQAKSAMLSISVVFINDEDIYEDAYIITACNWLTEDFVFHKIFMHMHIYDYFLDDLAPIEDFVKWAEKNTNVQEISDIITAIFNATQCLCSVVEFLNDERTLRTMNHIQNMKKISCKCYYHKIEFLTLMEKPFKLLINNHSNNDNFIRERIDQFKDLLLDKLPFSMFTKLLQLFKPLEHVKVVTMRNIRNLLLNAFNILNETSSAQISYLIYFEGMVLISFLRFLIYSYLNLHQRVGIFLDPYSKSIFTNDAEVKKLVLDELQDYYSNIDNSFGNKSNESIQYLVNYELDSYSNLPQFVCNENDDTCKWWQNSKHRFPGLATLAIKYLPLLGLDDNDVPLKEIKKVLKVYEGDKTLCSVSVPGAWKIIGTLQKEATTFDITTRTGVCTLVPKKRKMTSTKREKNEAKHAKIHNTRSATRGSENEDPNPTINQEKAKVSDSCLKETLNDATRCNNNWAEDVEVMYKKRLAQLNTTQNTTLIASEDTENSIVTQLESSEVKLDQLINETDSGDCETSSEADLESLQKEDGEGNKSLEKQAPTRQWSDLFTRMHKGKATYSSMDTDNHLHQELNNMKETQKLISEIPSNITSVVIEEETVEETAPRKPSYEKIQEMQMQENRINQYTQVEDQEMIEACCNDHEGVQGKYITSEEGFKLVAHKKKKIKAPSAVNLHNIRSNPYKKE